jgi:hypothetical protein
VASTPSAVATSSIPDAGTASTVGTSVEAAGSDLVWEAEDLAGPAGARYPDSTVSALATTEDTAWIIGAGTSTVYRLEPASGAVTTVDTGPVGGVVDVETGANWVWAVGGGEWLHRIEPDGPYIAETIEVEEGFAMTATDTALWVVSDMGSTLTRVDPTTGEVADVIPFDGVRYYFEPSVAATDTAVWLTDLVYEEGASVVRVDVATGRTDVVLTTPDLVPAAVVTTDAAVWVLFDGELIHLDPMTGERARAWPATTRALSEDHLAGVVGIVATDEGVWFGDADGNISLVDPVTEEIVDTIEVGLPTSLRLLGATANALWLVDQGSGDGPPEYVLTRIDIE